MYKSLNRKESQMTEGNMNSIKYISMGANVSDVKKFMESFCSQFNKTYRRYIEYLNKNKKTGENEQYKHVVLDIYKKNLKENKKLVDKFDKNIRYRRKLVSFNDILTINGYVDFKIQFDNMLERYDKDIMNGSGFSDDDMKKIINEEKNKFKSALEKAEDTKKKYQNTQYYEKIDYFLKEILDDEYLILYDVYESIDDCAKKTIYWDFDVKMEKLKYWTLQLADCENTIVKQAKRDIDNSTVGKLAIFIRKLLKI